MQSSSPIPPAADPPLGSHVVLCGLGRLGRRVLHLLGRLGERVVVITTEPPHDWPPPGADKPRLILGDARDDNLLREARIDLAKAVIITTSDDLANVSIALDARRLNGSIPVVVRLFDQQLGAHLEADAGIHRVLSTSAIAAPTFVGAALGDTRRASFDTGAGSCVIEDRLLDAGSPGVGQSVQDWAAAAGCSVIGLQRAGRWAMQDLERMTAEPGDRLTVLSVVPNGDPTAMARAGSGDDVGSARGRRLAGAWHTLARGMRAWWADVPRVFRWAAGLLLLVVVASVVVFHWQMGLPFVDALYFVVTIITTVGFGDYHLRDTAPLLKLYGVLLMLCGAAVMAMLFSIITDLVLSTRLRDVLALGCSQLRGHIIVVGLGNLGYRVVRELLRSGETVVAVERDASGKFVDTARSLMPVVLGNGRTEETLRKAGLAGAKAVLALTDDDIANLSIGLAAKRARPDAWAVLRVYDAALADKLRPSLGVDVVLSVAGEAAATFVASALGPAVLHGFVLGDALIVIARQTATKAAFAPHSGAAPDRGPQGAGLEVRRHSLAQED